NPGKAGAMSPESDRRSSEAFATGAPPDLSQACATLAIVTRSDFSAAPPPCERAVPPPHVAGVRESTEPRERAIRARRHQSVGQRRQALHQRRGEHEEGVLERRVRRRGVEAAEEI